MRVLSGFPDLLPFSMNLRPLLIRSAGMVGLSFTLVSCTPAPSTPTMSHTRPVPRVLHEWYDDGGPGEVKIRISLKDQIAEITRGGRDVGWCYVATGKEGHSTSAGEYRITEKIVDKYSNRYGWIEDEFGNVIDNDATPRDPVPAGASYVPAPMPYWMRLTSYGIGMHGGLIPEPGKPASHGCIRLPKDFVPVLFNEVKVGTPVTITHAPSRVGPRNQAPPPEFAVDDVPYARRVVTSRPLTSGILP